MPLTAGRPEALAGGRSDLRAAEIERYHEAFGGDLEAMVQRLQVSGRALKRRLKELGLEGKRA